MEAGDRVVIVDDGTKRPDYRAWHGSGSVLWAARGHAMVVWDRGNKKRHKLKSLTITGTGEQGCVG